jgi:hypothetical protein
MERSAASRVALKAACCSCSCCMVWLEVSRWHVASAISVLDPALAHEHAPAYLCSSMLAVPEHCLPVCLDACIKGFLSSFVAFVSCHVFITSTSMRRNRVSATVVLEDCCCVLMIVLTLVWYITAGACTLLGLCRASVMSVLHSRHTVRPMIEEPLP